MGKHEVVTGNIFPNVVNGDCAVYFFAAAGTEGSIPDAIDGGVEFCGFCMANIVGFGMLDGRKVDPARVVLPFDSDSLTGLLCANCEESVADADGGYIFGGDVVRFSGESPR